MERKWSPVIAIGGCLLVLLLLLIPIGLLIFVFSPTPRAALGATPPPAVVDRPRTELEEPTFVEPVEVEPVVDLAPLTELYQQVNPGVVNIQVQVQRGETEGFGVGSGFILSEEGYIVTNNHVVAGSENVIIAFFNGIEAEAAIIGADPDSDLAILKVDNPVEGSRPLPLGDSNQVAAGDWVIAIGNPFSLGGSMTIGIVSAVGRVIPSGVAQFNIPQAIQTDAAINPGNSGGPLLNLRGEVIGINAMIRTAGVGANTGVGFAIPSNILTMIAPELMAQGFYEWPWLGVGGFRVNHLIMRANNLESQMGAYIHEVNPDTPAERAGLLGTSEEVEVNGVEIPAGGDVIVQADGAPVEDFNQLLSIIAFKRPGDELDLVIIREGQQQEITATLEARPGRSTPDG